MYSETISNKVSVWFEMKEGLLACQGNNVKLNGATTAIYYHCRQTVVVWKSYEPNLFCTNNRFFFVMHKNGNNANIGIRGFISWKQKIQLQNVTPVSIEPLDLIPSTTYSSLH